MAVQVPLEADGDRAAVHRVNPGVPFGFPVTPEEALAVRPELEALGDRLIARLNDELPADDCELATRLLRHYASKVIRCSDAEY